MKKIFMVFVAFAAISLPVYPQVSKITPTGCDLTEATFPPIRGVRLGLSVDRLLALFPAAAKRRESREALERVKGSSDSEIAYITFYPSRDAQGDSFAGVDSVLVGLNRGRVIVFNIVYVGQNWTSIDEWVAKLSESLKLPGPQVWKPGPSEAPNKVLKCREIEIMASIQGGGASINVRNTEQQAIIQNTTASDEKQRRDFKP